MKARGVAILVVLVLAGCGAPSGANIQHFRVPSGAMLPTLKIGDRIAVYVTRRSPQVGDIVAFHPPAGAESATAVCGNSTEGAGHPQACSQPTPGESTAITFLKRVVAGPGDRISIVNGRVLRNGVAEKESYIRPCGGAPECDFPQPIVIPPGDYFVLGDNRGQSDDSRFWGPVPGSWIIGTLVR
jgi:signal peptidase I